MNWELSLLTNTLLTTLKGRLKVLNYLTGQSQYLHHVVFFRVLSPCQALDDALNGGGA